MFMCMCVHICTYIYKYVNVDVSIAIACAQYFCLNQNIVILKLLFFFQGLNHLTSKMEELLAVLFLKGKETEDLSS